MRKSRQSKDVSEFRGGQSTELDERSTYTPQEIEKNNNTCSKQIHVVASFDWIDADSERDKVWRSIGRYMYMVFF